MIDPDAFAVLIAEWCLDVQAGQQILIETTTLAQEPAVALHRAVLERGGWPLLRLAPGGLEADFYRHARDQHLDGVAPIELSEAEAADASVRIIAPASTNALADIDPALVARRARARLPLREAQARRRWALTIWPTPALAQQAGMPESEYADFVERALFLDQPDPVAAWSRLREQQARVIERLTPAREVHIETAGTDLRLNVEGRTWMNSDGRREKYWGVLPRLVGASPASSTITLGSTLRRCSDLTVSRRWPEWIHPSRSSRSSAPWIRNGSAIWSATVSPVRSIDRFDKRPAPSTPENTFKCSIQIARSAGRRRCCSILLKAGCLRTSRAGKRTWGTALTRPRRVHHVGNVLRA